MRGTIEQRFWNNVNWFIGGDCCWEFLGKKNKKGYGVVAIGFYKQRSYILAHRLSWILNQKQDIPLDLFVLHRCDNPCCVNPAHLFLGSLDDNNQDMKQKQRHVYAEGHPNATLSADQVRDVRTKYLSGLFTQGQLSEEYQVGTRAISKIVTRARWKSVS